MVKFRFQDLIIWQLSIEIADELFNIADDLEEKRLYKFAEQLRSAGMSMSNNIAEGSGSSSKKEFKQFLNIARRSTFENANILILLRKRNLIAEDLLENLLLSLIGFAAKSPISRGRYQFKANPLFFVLPSLPDISSSMPYALCPLRVK
jgi:four helix bundle protein